MGLSQKEIVHVVHKRDTNTFTICHMSIVWKMFTAVCTLYLIDIVPSWQVQGRHPRMLVLM